MKRLMSVVVLLILIVSLGGCSSKSKIEYISKTIGVDVPSDSAIEYTDKSKSFQGDGITYAKIELKEDTAEEFATTVSTQDGWNELPLTENIKLVMFGGTKDAVEYAYNYASEAEIPDVQNGYWLLIDRSAEAETVTNQDTELLNRASFNFTLAIYDIDQHILYYIEVDT